MGKANFTENSKRNAVVQITERGFPVAEMTARLRPVNTSNGANGTASLPPWPRC